MNKTFKVIFNRARATLMVANEITRSVQKKGTKTVLASAAALALGSTAAMADSLQGVTWDNVWNSESYPTGVTVDATGRTSGDKDIYGVTVSSTASGEAKATEVEGRTDFKIKVSASSQQGYTINQAAYGILSEKAKVTGVSETNPTFGGDSLTVEITTNFTGGGQAIGTEKYVNVSATDTSLSTSSSAGNGWGVNATKGGQVDLASSNSTQITSFVTGSNYTTTGNAYGVYAAGNDSAASPTYSSVNLTSKTVNVNVSSLAEFSSGSSGVAVGVQIADGASVNAESSEEGSKLTINGTSSNAELVGISSVAASGTFNHETTEINLNQDETKVITASVDATGIAVSNKDSSGTASVSTVAVGGDLTVNVRSDSATATGISVGNNGDVSTTEASYKRTGVTVAGDTSITATTKTGKAYGVNLEGYQHTITDSSASSESYYPAYVEFNGETTSITAKAEGYDTDDSPMVVGVNATKGGVSFVSGTTDADTYSFSVNEDSSVTIAANGKASDSTLAIQAKDDGNVDLVANKIAITSDGHGIKVSDDSYVYALAGNKTYTRDDDESYSESYSFNDGSSISITSYDKAVDVSDDSSVELIAEKVAINVTSQADPTAVTVDDSGFTTVGKTISVTSTKGTGIQAKNGGKVLLSSIYEKDHTVAEGSSITITAEDKAIATTGESTKTSLYSETIKISATGARENKVDALNFNDGEHSIVGKTTTITSNSNGMEVTGGAEVVIVDYKTAESLNSSTSPSFTDFTEDSSLSIKSDDEAVYVNGGSSVLLAASSVTLDSKSNLGTIQVENSNTVANDYFNQTDYDKVTTVIVRADNLTATNTYSSSATSGFGGATFAGYSNTLIDVEADTINATSYKRRSDLVRAYGNAHVSIAGGDGSSLSGNVVFAPEIVNSSGTTTSRGTTGQVLLTLSGEDSEWQGRSYIASGTPTHDSSGSLYTNNTNFKVALSDGAMWTVTGDSFFKTITLTDGGIVDASSDSVTNFIGAGIGTEVGTINVYGAKNELYINEDADISGIKVAMMKDSDGCLGKPELIVDTVTAFDIEATSDDTITEAKNRLTFVTNDDTEKGMLTIKEAFSINTDAFNATAGVTDLESATNTQNDAIGHYNFLQGTLVTESDKTAYVDTDLRLNNIVGDGDVYVKSENRVDVMPYEIDEENTTEAKTELNKLSLAEKASFYATDNESVSITTAEVGESASLTIKDNTDTTAVTDSDSDTTDARTATSIETLTVKKDGNFVADNNASVKLGTVNVANVESNTTEDVAVTVTNSGEVAVTTLNVGNNAKVSATGNTSVTIDNIKARSNLSETDSTGANAKVTLQKNDDVTVKNIETGAKAFVLIGSADEETKNTNTAQVGETNEDGTNKGVITLGESSSLNAYNASLNASTVTLADGSASNDKTAAAFIGLGKTTEADALSVDTLTLGSHSTFLSINNASVNISKVALASEDKTGSEVALYGNATATVGDLNLAKDSTFFAAENDDVTVKNINVGAGSKVLVGVLTDDGEDTTVTYGDTTYSLAANTNTAKIGATAEDGTNSGVVTLGAGAKLVARDAAVNASTVSLAGADNETGKTTFKIIGQGAPAADATNHYDSETISIDRLNLGNYADVTLTNNKSVALGTVSGVGDTAGTNTSVSVTGSEDVKVTALNLGASGKFSATGNGNVSVGSITTAESATVTIGEESDDQTAQIGSVTLGSNSTMNATNAVVAGENNAAVNVTVGSGATFNLTSTDKASSYVDALDVNGTFTAKDATVNVNELKGSGNVNVGVATTVDTTTTHTGANMYVKTLSMTGGSIYVDPIFGETSVVTFESLENDTLNTKLTAGPGALVTIGAGSADAAVAAVKANVEANSNSTNNLATAESLIYVAKSITFGDNGSLMSNPSATTDTTATAKTVSVTNGGALIIDQQAVGSQAFSGLESITVDSDSTLAVINVVAGTSFSLADSTTTTTGTITAITDSPFVVANQNGNTVTLTGTATDTGMSVIASMGVQSMLRRADMLLAETVADRSNAALDATKGVSLWADVRGEQYKQTSLGHGAGFKTNIGYGTIGAEVAPTDTTSLGVAFQYGKGTVKGDLYDVKNKTKNYGATLYGSTMLGDTGVKLVGEIAYIKSDNDITNNYYTGLNQDLDAKIFSAGLTVQKNFKLGSFDVTPSVGVRVSKLKTDDMKAGLSTIDSQSQTLVQVPVAVRFSANKIETASGWGITPNLKLAVVPTFGDKSIEVFDNKRTVIDASPFQGALGVTFTKGNFSINASANAGAGQRGSKSFGGKIGVNYNF